MNHGPSSERPRDIGQAGLHAHLLDKHVGELTDLIHCFLHEAVALVSTYRRVTDEGLKSHAQA